MDFSAKDPLDLPEEFIEVLNSGVEANM